MEHNRPYSAWLQGLCPYSSHLIDFRCSISVHFQPIHYHAICPPVFFPVSFKDKLSKDFPASIEFTPSFEQALARFMHNSPIILPAAGVHLAILGVACRSPWTGNGRIGRVSHLYN